MGDMISLYILFFLFFAFITLYRFHHGLFLLFLLLPTYLIRFDIGLIPTTLLEMMIWILCIIWLIKYNRSIIFNLKSLILKYKTFFIASSVFLLGATVAVFSSLHLKEAAGEWKAFYIEPFLVFLMLVTTIKDQRPGNKEQKESSNSERQNLPFPNPYSLFSKTTNIIVLSFILCGLATSVFAIYQHFTGWMVPWSFWQNGNSYRVTGWYGYPNAVALFLAPIVPLAIYLAKTYYLKLITKKQETLDPGLRANKSQSPHHKFKNFEFGTWLLFVSCILYLITAPLAIYYAKSTGGLIGLAAGIGTLLLIYKKTRWPSVIIGLVGIISILSIPQLGNIKQEVFAQDRSGQIRVAMWGEALALLSDRPILGAGLRSYVDRIVPYHTQVNGENIEIFHLQHNLFLSLWINIGLVGLFGFIWILISISNIQYSLFKKYKKLPTLHYFLISSIIIMLVMGLVDTPYMKNDLAVLFWGIIALLLISSYEKLEKFTT